MLFLHRNIFAKDSSGKRGDSFAPGNFEQDGRLLRLFCSWLSPKWDCVNLGDKIHWNQLRDAIQRFAHTLQQKEQNLIPPSEWTTVTTVTSNFQSFKLWPLQLYSYNLVHLTTCMRNYVDIDFQYHAVAASISCQRNNLHKFKIAQIKASTNKLGLLLLTLLLWTSTRKDKIHQDPASLVLDCPWHQPKKRCGMGDL